MRQHLTAAGLLAMAAACANAYGQTGTTIYGDFDEYLGIIRSSSGAQVTGLNDGAILRSRLGFKGGEDIGGGYRITFTLEQGIGADSGSAADATRP